MMRSRAAEARSVSPNSAKAAEAEDQGIEERMELLRDEARGSSPPLLENLAHLLKPGRTLRLPVGYVFAACGAVVVLLCITYMFAHRLGQAQATEQAQAKYVQGLPQQRGVNDPLSHEPDDLSAGGSATLTNGQPRSANTNRPSGTAPVHPEAAWGPVQPKTDPRQKGWNYFIVAETTPQGAVRLAEFCRVNGLETYVVAGKNDRSNRVIAFPGFQGSRLAPEVKALEDRIHQVGDKYKSQNKTETNMRDAYPAKFD